MYRDGASIGLASSEKHELITFSIPILTKCRIREYVSIGRLTYQMAIQVFKDI